MQLGALDRDQRLDLKFGQCLQFLPCRLKKIDRHPLVARRPQQAGNLFLAFVEVSGVVQQAVAVQFVEKFLRYAQADVAACFSLERDNKVAAAGVVFVRQQFDFYCGGIVICSAKRCRNLRQGKACLLLDAQYQPYQQQVVFGVQREIGPRFAWLRQQSGTQIILDHVAGNPGCLHQFRHAILPAVATARFFLLAWHIRSLGSAEPERGELKEYRASASRCVYLESTDHYR